jgi:hypothetical protein
MTIRTSWSRWLPHAAALALLALMVTLSTDFGYTWDERFQQAYGERIWEYLNGRLPRTAFDTDFGNEYLYGGVVEALCVAAQRLTGADTYLVRHVVTSIFGWLGIVFSGLLAGRLWGARAGWLAAGLLALAPRYFGDSMNNPKDIPFAALTMAVLYFTLTISASPPHVSWARVAQLIVTIAVAINIRPLGLALLGYSVGVILAVAAAGFIWRRPSGQPRDLLATGFRVLLVIAVAIPAGTLLWPWAQAAPFTRPIQAFLISSNARWAAGFPVLYGGRDLLANTLPWHYVPVWLSISLPPVILSGLVIGLILCRRLPSRPATIGLAVFAAVPAVAAIVRHATIYDGIRHLEFIVPPLVVLSAAGWIAALGASSHVRTGAIIALVLGTLEPLAFHVRNHPNQNVYFSPIIGGPSGAFGRFETDYWGNCMLQAVEWSADLASEVRMPLVVWSANLWEAVDADTPRFKSLIAAGRRSVDHHVDIRLLRGPRESVIQTASRPDVLYTVATADGAALCVVLPGPRYADVKERLDKTRNGG